MEDAFRSLKIESKEGYLEFVGPAKLQSPEQFKSLQGHVGFTLIKPTKIRKISIKFKGFSGIKLKPPYNVDISCTLLPKLKVPLLGKTNLAAGDHSIPWELDIPNIYPMSFSNKRAAISYKVIVSISTGLTRTLTAEQPIVVKRHLLACKELSPLIETKLYQGTLPGKFHYEIDAPQIIWMEQKFMPMAIKYVNIASQKPVKSIRTRIVQIELYRRRCLSKSESNWSTNNGESRIFDVENGIAESAQCKDTHIKYIKRAIPALIHHPEASASVWKRPFLIRHELHPHLSYTLDSPLLFIYHQLEVTFQFGMKHEEIKTKLPIMIASRPHKDQSEVNSMMKYAFEDANKSQILPFQLESRNQNNGDDYYSAHDGDNVDVIRDTLPLFIASHDNDDKGRGSKTVVPMFSAGNPVLSLTNTPYVMNSCGFLNQSVPTVSPESTAQYLPSSKQDPIKKFASAFDLSIASNGFLHIYDRRQPEERFRTTTHTIKKPHVQNKQLQPNDVDLANGKKAIQCKSMPCLRQLPPPPPPPPSKTTLLFPTRLQESVDSKVFSALEYWLSENATRHCQTAGSSTTTQPMKKATADDQQSVCSETSVCSSHNAPSLSSSATLSTSKSQPTLHSRPPSPVFSPAPGLPATIPLRPHAEEVQAVEELFPPDTSISPATNTIATSGLHSPHTTYALQRRIALSTISSLTNDSFQFAKSIIPSNRRRRASSNIDPEVQTLMHSSFLNSSVNGSNCPPPLPNSRYTNAQLPPIPVDAANKRLARVCVHDSDEENCTDQEYVMGSLSPPPLAQLPSNAKPVDNSKGSCNNGTIDITNENLALQNDCAPPRLPRLSFGNDFNISFGI
ncbi:hypothetical protein [Parasitella parasitica]|uniref:Arrestin C-terminal-like domain-containing protein n=1 Tax=Parasitella parasitica TaxID=35722 RepID=A0A0B7NAE8_9FUNG|nr:hypothetical protein [Parasitella parasitica]